MLRLLGAAVSLALVAGGTAVLLRPRLANKAAQDAAAFKKEAFTERCASPQKTETNALERLAADAAAYNASLVAEQPPNAALFETPPLDLTQYEITDAVFGYLELPAIDITLPVLLGAEKAHLDTGAAVLGGTSLPVGGAGTHCVIAAHRGTKSNEMFYAIDRLVPGDLVRFTGAQGTLWYEVTASAVLQPDDVRSLAIQSKEDLLTLITCHPYGSSRTRYAVYCRRTTPPEKGERTE